MLLNSREVAPSKLAWARFLLARALWDSHSDREQAIDLAQEARAALLKPGKVKSEELRQVEAWLSKRAKARTDFSPRATKPESL
jgi:hypothetical protein